jgi:hypothetical protein
MPSIALTVGGAELPAISRRRAIQWVLASVAASSLSSSFDLQDPAAANTEEPAPAFAGYGKDPVLTKVYKPGDYWPLVLDADRRVTATALADVILPADQYGPAASEVGVIEMLDDWISAPYDQQQEDQPHILKGLVWLEDESKRRFNKPFPQLSTDQQHAICDDICFVKTAKPEFNAAAIFFDRFRMICGSAYFSTPVGWKAIGYVGNTPLEKFDGPPQEVLDKLGVTQTVE